MYGGEGGGVVKRGKKYNKTSNFLMKFDNFETSFGIVINTDIVENHFVVCNTL